MGILDGPMGKVANSLVNTLGGSGTYHRAATDGDFDTSELDIVGDAPTTSTVGVAPGGAHALKMFDETLVEMGDRVGIVSRVDLGFTPNPGADELTWLGTKWRIEAVEPYNSGDQDAAFALLLRS